MRVTRARRLRKTIWIPSEGGRGLPVCGCLLGIAARSPRCLRLQPCRPSGPPSKTRSRAPFEPSFKVRITLVSFAARLLAVRSEGGQQCSPQRRSSEIWRAYACSPSSLSTRAEAGVRRDHCAHKASKRSQGDRTGANDERELGFYPKRGALPDAAAGLTGPATSGARALDRRTGAEACRRSGWSHR